MCILWSSFAVLPCFTSVFPAKFNGGRLSAAVFPRIGKFYFEIFSHICAVKTVSLKFISTKRK